uniref:Endocuticle structural glycoprotein SgAbd-2 n=1 Tax=Bracon brevicornis TaxID=1563983 RepID=A0A6V7KWX4_9HYME
MNGYVAIFLGLLAVANAGLLTTEPVPILSQDTDVSFDGNFRNSYQTGNGITVQEQGYLKQLPGAKEPANVIQGSASWTSPEGVQVSSSWEADENGARYQGSHLPVAPTPPPIPVLIQRALEYIAAHPEQNEDRPAQRQPQYNSNNRRY